MIKKITREKFTIEAVKLYQIARLATFKDEKITRGRSHTISSKLEDLFAKYLVDNIPGVQNILIDQPISVQGMNTTYPDISIISNNQIVAFCDLKTDLGWNRNGLESLSDRNINYLKKVRGLKCRYKDGNSKIMREIEISKNVIYDIAVLSDKNISRAVLSGHIEKVHTIGDIARIYILTKGVHPNDYRFSFKNLVKEVHPDNTEFDTLESRLKKLMQ